jgi:lysophospholipase L1-like esterase
MKKKVIIGLMLIGVFFIYGVAVGVYKIFPYNILQAVKSLLKDNTNLIPYAKTKEYLIRTELYDKAYETNKADIVMLGDSITYAPNWNELFNSPHVVNRGISGDSTECFLNRLENILKLEPKKVFIMGGINDIISGKDVNTIFNNYKLILNKLLENNIEPIIQSTLYTTTDGWNKNVTILNKLLSDYAKENNINYIDLNSKLSKNNTLISDYTVGDGLHLNYKGYIVWKNEIRNLIQ